MVYFGFGFFGQQSCFFEVVTVAESVMCWEKGEEIRFFLCW
jgi:hypothetical protein